MINPGQEWTNNENQTRIVVLNVTSTHVGYLLPPSPLMLVGESIERFLATHTMSAEQPSLNPNNTQISHG